MIITPTNGLVFESKLKTLYKKGKIKVEVGLYGGKLTKKNVTDEHLQAKFFGGKKSFDNIALATKENNWKRGCEPIENYLTYEMLRNYLKQFVDVKVEDFDGNKYILAVRKKIKELINAETD